MDTWSFLFWSRRAEKAYEIVVQGGTDIISQQEITDLPENVDPSKPIRGWMESTMALLKANQEVGDSLRALGQLNRIRVELFASQSASKSSMTNAEDEGTDGAWKVIFEKTNGEAEAVEVNNDDVTTSAEPEIVPHSLALTQNYPNPFNPSTNISFTLPASGQVSLIVYNILGQKVAQLVRQSMASGAHTVSFDASKMSSGLYIYQLQFGEQQITRQMMLLK